MTLGIFCTVARTELKEIDPQVSDKALLYLNKAIRSAFELGKGFSGDDDQAPPPNKTDGVLDAEARLGCIEWLLQHEQTVDVGEHLIESAPAVLIRYLKAEQHSHEWADKLAAEISDFFGLSIGEHSSANNPWFEAWDNMPEKAVYDAELVAQSITDTEADALHNAMGALRMDRAAGPVGLGSLCVLEGLLTRNGYGEESEPTVYDYYVELCNSKGFTPLAAERFPAGLQELAPTGCDAYAAVKSGRVYYHTKENCLCQVVANFWDDGACLVAERYTDDITDSYFTTEVYQLREVLL